MAKEKGFPQNETVKHWMLSKFVCSVIQAEGFEASFVGGGVRDLLMNRTAKDFDIATNMPIEQVAAMFPSEGNNKINHKFFVHTFELDSILIDVAQYRDDSEMVTRMGHVPKIGDRDTDAIRRDFTINAIYLDPVSNVFFDPLGGSQDILDKVIRPTDDPDIIFAHDPVRLIRGLRFALQFGFRMDFDFDKYRHLLMGKQSDAIRARIEQEFLKIARLPVMKARKIGLSSLINHYLT